jgi:hypothetical protein
VGHSEAAEIKSVRFRYRDILTKAGFEPHKPEDFFGINQEMRALRNDNNLQGKTANLQGDLGKVIRHEVRIQVRAEGIGPLLKKKSGVIHGYWHAYAAIICTGFRRKTDALTIH